MLPPQLTRGSRARKLGEEKYRHAIDRTPELELAR